MPISILATKLYIPHARLKLVLRPRLIEQLNGGLLAGRKLTVISAAAGFGKTTLASEWIAGCGCPVAWLSLDEGDGDPIRFLTYLVAALQTLALPNVQGTGNATATVAHLGAGVLGLLQSPRPPSVEVILTALLNDIATIPENFVLVLDDYHLIDTQPVDQALTFLLEHLPKQMHLVIATREDPNLPLARLRARGQLTELRIADLRFTHVEAAEFLNQVMGLTISAENVAALESRTEGWIAGLQLAALALQGSSSTLAQQDTSSFIQSFTGSHHFVLDYLLEEVLHQQSESVQTFLLRTSVLDRMCGPLCDAVLGDATAPGQATLEMIEQANLFIIPLDNERRWYRYHHLFADLLRQRLHQYGDVAEYHIRASQWYEENGLELEAFQHASAAHDIARTLRLIEGKGMPMQFRGAARPILNWLATLPTAVLDEMPALWVTYASALLVIGQVVGVEEKARAAEIALEGAELTDANKDLIGRIASIRASVAVTQHQVDAIVTQSRRALEYLHPNNLPVRVSIIWTLGYAYQLQGNRVAALDAYTEAAAASKAIGHSVIAMMSVMGKASIQEMNNELHQAAETFRAVLQMVGDSPPPPVCDVYFGLAHIYYQWNDLNAAQEYLQKSIPLALRIENTDRFANCEIFRAHLMLAFGDTDGAAALLVKTEQYVRQHHFLHKLPEIAAAQVRTLLLQGNLTAAAQLAQAHDLPVSQVRVYLAQGNPSAALTLLAPLREQMQARGWHDERLKIIILQAVASHLNGEKEQGLALLGEALKLSEPGGFIRIFVDEGAPMMELLESMKDEVGRMKEYIHKILAAFGEQKDLQASPLHTSYFILHPLLSPRELKVLQLMAQGLSNREIGERLFLALSTVKGHNQKIFDKLQAQSRTDAIARARELGVI